MRRTLPPIAVFLVLALGAAALGSPPASAEDGPSLVPVTGVVRDDAGAPLPDVEVNARSYGQGEESYDSAFTGEDGSFTLHLVPGKATASAWSRELGRGGSTDFEVSGNETTIELTIPRPPPRDAIVTGVVRGSDGEPIEGARVSIGAGCCISYARGGVAESDGGTATVSNETAPADEPAPSEPASPPPEPEREDLIMPRECCWNEDHQTALTDAEGRYRFETYAGLRQLTAYAEGHATSTTEVEARSGDTVEADLRLEKVPDRDAVLRGKVVDAQTGAPVAGAHVSVHNVEWSRYEWTATGADGAFTLTTLPGWTQVHVSASRGCCGDARPLLERADGSSADLRAPERDYHGFATTFDLESGDNDRTFRLVPKPEPAHVLTGYVLDRDTETGIEGATVNVWNHETGDWGSATTDATGSYRILVRPGHHQMNAWADGHLGSTQTLLVEGDKGATRADLVLMRGAPKYAPCEDCDHAIAYEEAAVAHDEAAVAGGDEGASQTRTAEESARAPAFDAAAADEGGQEGAASYTGSGGGLPPYDPAQVGTVPASADPPAPVPGLGLAGVAAALGVALLALRRR